jgi:hypothetical protein
VSDAEVVGPNRLRRDTRNVAAAELRPGPLVDATKPVEVVWNGVVRSATAREGRLDLQAEGRKPAALEKTDRLAGPFEDAVSTPFAIVLGRSPAIPRCGAPASGRSRASWPSGATGRRWSRGSSRTPRSPTPTRPATRCCWSADRARTRWRSGWRAEFRSRSARTRSSWTGRPSPRRTPACRSCTRALNGPRVAAPPRRRGLWFADWQNAEWDFRSSTAERPRHLPRPAGPVPRAGADRLGILRLFLALRRDARGARGRGAAGEGHPAPAAESHRPAGGGARPRDGHLRDPGRAEGPCLARRRPPPRGAGRAGQCRARRGVGDRLLRDGPEPPPRLREGRDRPGRRPDREGPGTGDPREAS